MTDEIENINEGVDTENKNPTGHRAPLTWQGHEYLHFEKTTEWYWILGLFAVAGAVTALIFKNLLFAIFILVMSFVLAIFASRKPEEVTFSITQRGVLVNERLYPYQSLKSFGMEDSIHGRAPKLILESNKILTSSLIIPLDNVHPNDVHDFLFNFLPEEDHVEPLIHKIMEWLGF